MIGYTLTDTLQLDSGWKTISSNCQIFQKGLYKVLEFKKEGKDCVSLDRKLMDEKNCIERRILKADLNSQLKRMQLEIC